MANINDRKEACKSYLEQTKLLITLASSFVIAPAVLLKDLADTSVWPVVLMEFFFIGSVLLGYLVNASIAGTQNSGDYDIWRDETRVLTYGQIGTYVAGLIVLICVFVNQPSKTAKKEEKAINKDTIFMILPDTLNVRLNKSKTVTKIKYLPRRTGNIHKSDSSGIKCNCCHK